MGDPGPRLQPGPDRLARAHLDRGALRSACTGSPPSSSASSGSPTSSGRSCAPRRPRRCGSSSRPRSPTRRATSASSTASTPRSGCSRAPTTSPSASSASGRATSTPTSTELFDEMLKQRVDRCAAEPEDTEALVEAITLYHMVIEGVLALTGQHFIIGYNERAGDAAGVRRGVQEGRPRRAPPRRLRRQVPDRHGGADDRYREAIQRTLVESLPVAEGVLRPPFAPDDDEEFELFGVSMARDAGVRRSVPDPPAQGHRSCELIRIRLPKTTKTCRDRILRSVIRSDGGDFNRKSGRSEVATSGARLSQY